MTSFFALVTTLAIITGPRSIDPAVPTSVPAPEGAEVSIDGAAIVDEPDLGPIADPVAAPPKPRVAPPRGPDNERRRWPESKRRGALLMAGVGAGGCEQDGCATLKAVPWFNLTGGYRFGRFAPVLTLQGGIGPAKAPTGLIADDDVIALRSAKDTRSFLHLGAGTLLHLLMSTPFDPYFGLTIGYLRSRARFRAQGESVMRPGDTFEFDVAETVHRGALGIIIGMGFRVRERLTIGARVDVLVPFAGKSCATGLGAAKTCIKLSDIEGVDPGQLFPRPWAATLQVGVVL